MRAEGEEKGVVEETGEGAAEVAVLERVRGELVRVRGGAVEHEREESEEEGAAEVVVVERVREDTVGLE